LEILHDLRCLNCDATYKDQVVDTRRPGYGVCERCPGILTWIPAGFVADAWGAPKYIQSFDQTFDSKSELRAYCKANAWEPAGDAVGGAKNREGFRNKRYSYSGQTRRDMTGDMSRSPNR
jgi:hypothetical protein